MTLEQELLNQKYTFAINYPNFEGDKFATLYFYKQIDSENYLIDIEIEINFVFESHEECEIDEIIITDIKVINDESEEQIVTEDIISKIELLIETEY